MKKIILAACLALVAAPLWAQKAGDFGAGVVAGSPTGASAKYWLDDKHALDAGLGFNGDLVLTADYLWHLWGALPQPSQGKLPAYFGVGARLQSSNNAQLGVRGVAGLAYWLPRDPVEVFMEIAPVLQLTNGVGLDVDGGLGIRYYFLNKK